VWLIAVAERRERPGPRQPQVDPKRIGVAGFSLAGISHWRWRYFDPAGHGRRVFFPRREGK